MPIPERELFIVLRELHAWLDMDDRTDEPLALKDALQTLFTEAAHKAMEPLIPEVAELVRAGDPKAAAKLLRETFGMSLGDAARYVNAYANAIAGKP